MIMSLDQKCFLFVFLLFLWIMAGFTPGEALSTGGNERKIIIITLNKVPSAAFAEVSIGDPPVKRELHIDTGTELTWVVQESDSRYDPSKSSSFSYRSCDGLSNSRLVTPSMTKLGQCDYNVRLADRTAYKGTLGTETFTFDSGERRKGMLNNVLFGFGRTVGGQQAAMGTLGLKLGELSIVKSLGGKFSICIGSFNDIGRETHFLAFGNDAVLDGVKVSLDTKELTYRINLTSIIFRGEVLDQRHVLWRSKSILDTGTSSISLVRELFDDVYTKIEYGMIVVGYKDAYMRGGLLCHNGRIPSNQDLGIYLQLDDVRLSLSPMELFNQIDDEHFCLSMGRSPTNVNLIGLTIFQNHNIGFDIPNEKLYVKRVECNRLTDSYRDELAHNGP